MKIWFTEEALLAVREKRAWWLQHREKAPLLFVQELATVIGKLRAGTDAERQEFAARGGHIIWRILMPQTRNHVYYRIGESAKQVDVLLIWNATAAQILSSNRWDSARR